MKRRTRAIPSFQTGPILRDGAPRRYKDAPTTVAPSGYVLEWCPTHPKATHGVYFQHRLVMECKLGRFLHPREAVHHKNRDRTDNRLENLELSATHSEHMRQHWQGRGKNDPKLIERVRKAASDLTKNISSLGVSPTTVQAICRENGIEWIPQGARGRARLLTDAKVREALRGRSAIEAAARLGVNVMTLYNRFDHLLAKRTKPMALDEHQKDILRLAYKERVSRMEIARRYGVSDHCVKKSIQRWSKQGAKLDGAALPELPRTRPGPKPQHKGPSKV